LKPLFDLHIGHSLSDRVGFKQYLSDIDDKTFIIGGGDILDSIIVQDPRFRKGLDASETEAIIDDQIDEAYELLKPYRDKIICMGIGNHEQEVVKRHGTNPMKRLCKALDCEYMGLSYLLALKLRHPKNGHGRRYICYVHHGFGGGSRTEGGEITKYSRFIMSWDADAYLVGHGHTKHHKAITRGYHGGSKMLSRNLQLCLCGSFKKNLTDDETTTWEESCGFPLRSIGGLTLKLRPTRDWVDVKVEG